MQKFPWPCLVLFTVALVLCAGCISTPTGPAAATTPAGNSSLAGYALLASDLPAGWSQLSSHEKTAGEISAAAHNLGWQQGYVVTYTRPADNTTGTCTLTQTVTRYSTTDMPGIVALVATNERRQGGLAFSDLALPATGSNTRAFAAILVNATPSAAPTDRGMAALAYENGIPDATEGYTEVVFSNGDILDVLRMTGDCPAYDTLRSLAETAYKKQG